MKRQVFWAFLVALLFVATPHQARAACDYDIGGSAPYTFSEFEIDLDEELACLQIGVFVQAYDADLDTWAGTTPASGVATALATPSSANLRSAVTDEVGTGALMFGLAAGMADDLSCTASQVVRRNSGDTAFECATFAGGGDALVANSLAQFAATTSLELAGVISNETGSGALMFGTSPSITTDITIPNTGLHLLDTNASHDLIVAPGSDLTADRTLTITTGDADRTLTLGGNVTLTSGSLAGTVSSGTHSGTNTGDQTITLTGDVTGTGTGSFSATIGADTVGIDELDLVDGDTPVNGDCLTYDTGAGGSIEAITCPGAGGGIGNVVEDLTPQLGGSLDTNGQAIEFGTAATDTSVVRSGAGDLSIEGNVVYRAGGTDVALADGGTGASLTDPNADRLMFWDDSAGATAYLTMGTAYTFDTTTLRSPTESFCVAASDESTAITTGTAKVTFRMPYAFTLTNIRGSLNTVSSSGSPLIDINEAGTSVATTNKLLIDVSEKTSVTAATAITLTDTSLADDAEMTIDIDTAGTGAKGLKVCLIGYQT